MSRVMQAEPRGLQWVAMSRGSFPKFAVEAGIDSGKKLYVARASHAGGVVPGKLHVGHSSAYIAYDGKEISMPNYEVLIGPTASLSWVESSNGQVPQHAVIGGRDPGGETYYIGRVVINRTVTVGKVHPTHKACYVPYDGKEHKHTTYEILVRNLLGRALNV